MGNFSTWTTCGTGAPSSTLSALSTCTDDGTSTPEICSIGVSIADVSVVGRFCLGASTGVAGSESLSSFGRLASRFFSAVRRKTLIVVLNDLLGLQSSADKGECSQTGHDAGRLD